MFFQTIPFALLFPSNTITVRNHLCVKVVDRQSIVLILTNADSYLPQVKIILPISYTFQKISL